MNLLMSYNCLLYCVSHKCLKKPLSMRKAILTAAPFPPITFSFFGDKKVLGIKCFNEPVTVVACTMLFSLGVTIFTLLL